MPSAQPRASRPFEPTTPADFACGAPGAMAVQVSGPSGYCLSREEFDRLKDVLQRFCDGKTKQELFDGALQRKLLRDLWHMRGQALAIAWVLAAATATFVRSEGVTSSRGPQK